MQVRWDQLGQKPTVHAMCVLKHVLQEEGEASCKSFNGRGARRQTGLLRTCSQRWCRKEETSCCSCAWLAFSCAVTCPAASSASTRALPLSAAAASACTDSARFAQLLHNSSICGQEDCKAMIEVCPG